MKKSFWIWELFGFAFTSLMGTLLHFLYDWLGGAIWIAPFSGVNESTFEHMKLIFWPSLIYALFQSIFFREQKNFWCVKIRGILVALALIPILFYAYNGVIGRSGAFINIAIFFIAAAISYIYEYRAFKKGKCLSRSPKLSIFILICIAALFVIFTFHTPHLEIFRDPISGSYGI
jgi:hypothetical protein